MSRRYDVDNGNDLYFVAMSITLDILDFYSSYRNLLLESVSVANEKSLIVPEVMKRLIAAHASELKEQRPVAFSYFCSLLKTMLSQEELSLEGLIDLMTLNFTDNRESNDVTRFGLAIEVFWRARNVGVL